MPRGGKRPNSGPQKGVSYNKTIVKRLELEKITSFVSERLTPILQALYEKGVGCAIIDKKDDTGEKIFDLPPNENALRLLLEYGYGKPSQAVDVTSGDEPLQAVLVQFISNPEDVKGDSDTN